jgi:hypothetical protein
MTLIVPQPTWPLCTTNISGTPSGNVGTLLTAGTANVDGTAVSCIAAITHTVQMLLLTFHGSGVSATNTSMLCDILIDPAGGSTWNTAPLINDLMVGYTQNLGNCQGLTYSFPIFIKSGTSIGARVRSATASNPVRIVVKAYGGIDPPDGLWCGQNVQEIGITAASSTGQSHTPGNTGTFSTWTNLGSTLTQPCGALQFAVQGGALTNMNNIVYHWQLGVASTQIGSTLWAVNTTTELVFQINNGPIFYNLPAGTQLMIRATASATAQAIDVAAWAVS